MATWTNLSTQPATGNTPARVRNQDTGEEGLIAVRFVPGLGTKFYGPVYRVSKQFVEIDSDGLPYEYDHPETEVLDASPEFAS